MGEEAPLYGVDSVLVLTNPGVQQCNLSIGHSLLCTQDRPCVVLNYIRPEVGLFKQNTADLEE
jgi:hypothetical protein